MDRLVKIFFGEGIAVGNLGTWKNMAIGAIGLTFALAPSALADATINRANCTYLGKKLYGRVQVVESFPDVKVQVVTAFPDLKVQAVTSFPDDCGKWHFVEHFPDLKVQFVNHFSDLKIQFVDAFPGVN